MPTHARRRQKTATIILSALALVAVAACGSDNNSSGSTEATASSGSTESTASSGSTESTASSGSTESTAANADPLGTPNAATGTPIKIGLVNDGKTDAIDNSSALATVEAVAQYANEYLGGLNGQPIEVVGCETGNTPTGATTCGVQMVNDKVAAVLVGGSAQDTAIFDALTDSGIPYITATSASSNIITKPGAFVFTNPIAAIAAPIPLAQENGAERVGFIVIDVPAATGPISQIATPFYQKANVAFDMIPISPTVADMTPQIQQAISQGDELFTIAGGEAFAAGAIKALKQLGFTGDIIAQVNNPSPDTVASIPGGYEGIINVSANTDDPTDPDVVLFNAIMDKYASGTEKNVSAQNAFVVAMAFVRSLTGATSAVDAPSVTAAMSSMPSAIPLPLGGGMMIQCGARPRLVRTEHLHDRPAQVNPRRGRARSRPRGH